MNNPSTMTHSFSDIPDIRTQRSVFDRSQTYKSMFNSGDLIPFLAEEVLPGDTFKAKANLLVRMPSALIRPVMDNMFIDTFYFYVPNRILWTNWRKFCGEQANPGDSIAYTIPVFTAFNPAAESLSDYLGIPPLGGGATIAPISLFHRAYNMIYNEWFRDQNLQSSITQDVGDGPDTITNYTVRKRGKRHDYFTSCLPWTQKGTAQSISIGTTAPVSGIGKLTRTATYTNKDVYVTGGGATPVNYPFAEDFANGGSQAFFAKYSAASSGNPEIYADLSSAAGVTINNLRQALQIQELLERDARGGTRFPEIMRAQFGVDFPDMTYRPEFLGGRRTPIMISEVEQTSATSAQPTGLGNLAAMAKAASIGDGFVKSFVEHGVILGIACVTADLTYQQGLHKKFTRSTRYDFYMPALANLGEQSVLNKEIYLQGSANTAEDAAVFGYQERWAEYRYGANQITGKLRSTYATPLDMWHLAQKFTALPTLGDTFIKESVPVSRIIAVTSEPEFVLDAYIDIKAVRPMPVYSVPGLSSRI